MKLWDGDPAPVWFAEGDFGHRPPLDGVDLWTKFLRGGGPWCEFRAVPIDRLPRVLRSGIDVDPTDGAIWVAEFDKAWEYCDLPKVVLALEQHALAHSFVSCDRDTDADRLEELSRTFPYRQDEGDEIWFSKVKDPKPGYEVPYGRYIPGNAREALRAVFLFGTGQDLATALRALEPGSAVG